MGYPNIWVIVRKQNKTTINKLIKQFTTSFLNIFSEYIKKYMHTSYFCVFFLKFHFPLNNIFILVCIWYSARERKNINVHIDKSFCSSRRLHLSTVCLTGIQKKKFHSRKLIKKERWKIWNIFYELKTSRHIQISFSLPLLSATGFRLLTFYDITMQIIFGFFSICFCFMLDAVLLLFTRYFYHCYIK